MGDWKEIKLIELCTFQRGHDLPKTVMKGGSYPVAGSNSVIGFHNKHTTKGPSLTIGRSGNIGTPYYFSCDFWAHNTVLYVKDFHGNNPKFAYYLLKTIDFSQYNSGSAVPTLNRNHIHEHEVFLPPLPEQESIAEVLSSLDDKIDLLQRQNKTLEEMAETLFRQWFIEEADDSWEDIKFKDLVKHVKPGTNFQPKRVDVGIPFLNVKNLDGGFLNFSDINYITEVEYKRVHKNWIPEANDLLISRIGTLGVVAVITERDIPVAVHYNMINLKSKRTSFQFLFFLLKSVMFQEKYESITRQSVQEYVAIEDVENIELRLPINQKSFIEKENTLIELFNKIKANYTQIKYLESLRDILLPKLMNGQVICSI